MSGEIRYIGKTVKKLETRLIAHLTDARRGGDSHKNRWLRKCLDAGLRPSMWLLEEVCDGTSWQTREREWISKAIALGFDLTNQTAGGEGLDFIDDDARAAYAQSMSIVSKEKYWSLPHMREALAEGNRRSWAANRQRRIDALMDGWDDASRKRHQEIMESVRQTPDFKAAKSAGAKKAWLGHRATIIEAFARPETKAKQAAAAKASWADPDKREAKMARWKDPESRAKQAAELATRQAKIQAARTPEVRAKQAASLKANWAKRKATKNAS